MALSYQFLGILRIQTVIFFKDLINSSLSITYIHTYVHTYIRTFIVTPNLGFSVAMSNYNI